MGLGYVLSRALKANAWIRQLKVKLLSFYIYL
jgi:hypothetical protein